MASPTTWNGHEVSTYNMFMVSPLALEPDADANISRGREPIPIDDDLVHLADQMLTHGQINPITVRNIGKGRYGVVLGFRRFEAAKHLVESGKAPDFRLKCITGKMTDKEAALRNFSENLHKQDPSPMQVARGIQILMTEHGLSKAEVAEQCGRSPGWVDYHVNLTMLPPSIQSSVDLGDLPVATAVELGKIEGDDEKEAVLKAMQEEGDVSADAARNKRREAGARVKRGPKQLKEFLKLKSQDGECGSNVAVLLLDYLDGKISEDDAVIQWDKFTVSMMNVDMEALVEGQGEEVAA